MYTETTATHYNIGAKQAVNPFENTKFVILSDFSRGKDILQSYLDHKCEAVTPLKMNGSWKIAYDITHMDFITLIKWHSPIKGKFYFKSSWIEFNLVDEVMYCW